MHRLLRPIILLVLLSLFVVRPLKGQELRCVVQVVAPGIQGTNKAVFETLQKAIMEFMNGQQWTNNKFEQQERIDCSFLITIKEMSSVDEFSGTLQIQSRRPVFNSSYQSQIINYMDQNFSFSYVEFEPLLYNASNIKSNLIAVLAYYAYIIIGYDYDTYSLQGGTPWFQEAERIVNMMQNSSESGWSSTDANRNRYWLTENLLNEDHKSLRNCYYNYHRKGLDIMAEKSTQGRAIILSALELLADVYKEQPNSFAIGFFFDAKSEEIINIFSESPPMEKERAITLLSKVDPANSDEYEEMK
jgi:hypothetical protein